MRAAKPRKKRGPTRARRKRPRRAQQCNFPVKKNETSKTPTRGSTRGGGRNAPIGERGRQTLGKISCTWYLVTVILNELTIASGKTKKRGPTLAGRKNPACSEISDDKMKSQTKNQIKGRAGWEGEKPQTRLRQGNPHRSDTPKPCLKPTSREPRAAGHRRSAIAAATEFVPLLLLQAAAATGWCCCHRLLLLCYCSADTAINSSATYSA